MDRKHKIKIVKYIFNNHKPTINWEQRTLRFLQVSTKPMWNVPEIAQLNTLLLIFKQT